MASAADLAYTVASVKRIEYFSPIFQSFNNKNKCSSVEHKNRAGTIIFRLFSFKHAYIKHHRHLHLQ